MDRLQLIVETGDVNDFRLRQIERDAEKLMKIDVVEARSVLGASASLRGDVRDVHKHHGIVVKLSGSEPVVALTDYSVSLCMVGKMSEALKVILQAHELTPNDQDILKAATNAAFMSGHFTKGKELCALWKERFGDEPFVEWEIARPLVNSIEKGNFTEESVQEIIHIAHQIRRESGVIATRNSRLFNCPETGSFAHELHLHTSPSLGAQLNEELADRISSRSDLMADPGLNFVVIFIGTRSDDRRC